MATIIGVSLLILAGCNGGETAQAAHYDHPAVVEIAVATKAPSTILIREVGAIQPLETILISSEVTGKVLETPHDTGSVIGDGDMAVLVRIDASRHVTAVDMAEARVDRARAAIDFARAELTRSERLKRESGISASALDRATLHFREAVAGLKEAEKKLSDTRKTLADTQIKGIPGYHVSRRFVDPGELVTMGQPVIEIVDIRTVTVRFQVGGSDRAVLDPKQTVRFTVREVPLSDEGTPVRFEGRIKSLSPTQDAETYRYPVEVVVDNSQSRLLPGMSVEVELVVPAPRGLVVVPRQALFERFGATQVYRITDKGTLAMHKVRPLRAGIDADYSIIEGLPLGSKVVGTYLDGLREGQKVQALTPIPIGSK